MSNSSQRLAPNSDEPDPTEIVREVLEEDDRKHQVEVHAWEGAIEKTWDQLHLDEYGKLQYDDLLNEYERKRTLTQSHFTTEDRSQVLERGLVRNLVLVVDMSESMMDTEASRKSPTNPYGIVVVKDLVENFIREFFLQNPVSQLGVVIAHDGKAQRITDISSNPDEHISKFRDAHSNRGMFSLQNALLVAGQRLIAVAPQGNKEILVVSASLSTVDPGDVFEVIALLAAKEIRSSVVGFNAEVYVYKFLAEKTRGMYSVVQSARDLDQQLQAHVSPPALPKQATTTRTRKWLQMGFPDKVQSTSPTPCACHGILSYSGYTCPRCGAKSCTVPSTCGVCQLMLAYSSSLARSYHHLFPPAQFDVSTQTEKMVAIAKAQRGKTVNKTYVKEIEYMTKTTSKKVRCHGCNTSLSVSDTVICKCPSCEQWFCIDCDELVHSALYVCPGCAALPKVQEVSRVSNDLSASVQRSGAPSPPPAGPHLRGHNIKPEPSGVKPEPRSDLQVKLEPSVPLSSSKEGL